jgi:hypothetical protein
METIDRFLTIAATAQARGRVGSEIGSSEQVAAIQLLAELGVSEKVLTAAAYTSLAETIRWSTPIPGSPQIGGGDPATIAQINMHARAACERIERSRNYQMLLSVPGPSRQWT